MENSKKLDAMGHFSHANKNFNLPMFHDIMEDFKNQIQKILEKLTRSSLPDENNSIAYNASVSTLTEYFQKPENIKNAKNMRVITYWFHKEAAQGCVLFLASNRMLNYLVINTLGGKIVNDASLLERKLTEIENLLAISTFDLISNCFAIAFKPVKEISLIREISDLTDGFSSVDSISSKISNDINYIFEIQIQSSLISESIYFCIPYFSIESFRNKLKQYDASYIQDHFVLDAWSGYMKSCLEKLHIDLQINLAARYISLKDLDNISSGIILKLKVGSGDDVYLNANGVVLGAGEVGSLGQHLAIKVKQINNQF